MLSGLAFVWLGSYGAIAVSFLINIVLTRSLGPERFGHVALLLTAAQIMSVGPNASLAALVRFGASEFALRGRVEHAFWDRMSVVVPWYAVGALVLGIGAPWLAPYLGIDPGWLVVVLAYVISGTQFLTATALLRALGRMGGYGVALTVERILALVILFALTRWLPVDPTTVIVVFIATSAVVTTVIVLVLARGGSLRPSGSRSGVREMWRFSLPLFASSWLGVFGTQWIDYLVIRSYLPLGELGLYALAYQVAGAVQQLAIAVGTFLLPTYSNLIATGRHEDVRLVLRRLLPYWLLAFGLLLCLAMPVSEVLVPLIFGSTFAQSIGPLRLLLVATILLGVFNTFATVLTAYAVNWPVAWLVALSVATNVVLDLVLVPRAGITGAATATVVAYTVSAAGILWIARRRLAIPTVGYGIFAAPVALAWIAASAADIPPGRIVAASAAAVILVAVARLFRLPDRGDLVLLRRIGEAR